MDTTPTLNELIYSVWNVVRGRANAQDTINEELIKFHILNVRAQLIRQDSNKGYTTDPYIVQDLGCVELERVDAGECCVVSGCTILRTKLQIPSTIELHHRQLITRIGPIVKTAEPFDVLSYENVPLLEYSRFAKLKVNVFMKDNNGYIYVIVPNVALKTMKYINVQVVLEDPTKASAFNQCTVTSNAHCESCDDELQTPCYDEDTPFPIKHWMVPALIEMVTKVFIKPQSITSADLNSDGKLAVEVQADGQPKQ